jgi:hypothetical protein
MRVYRIEHKSRFHGPYIIPFSEYECDAFCEGECQACEDYNDITCLAYAIVGDHQDKYHRSPRGIHRHEVCGFDSLYALEAWFDGWLDKLFAVGYVVAEFDGVKVQHHGNGQVTFNKYMSNRLTSTTN